MKKQIRSLSELLLITVFSLSLQAQEKSPGASFRYPEWNLRTNLSSWADYDAGPSLGAGVRWSNRLSMAVEPTWIFYNGFVTDQWNRVVPYGVRLRADLKYYITRRRSRGPEFYVAPEWHFKSVRTKKEDLFGINCQNGQCAYFQNAVYTEKKREIGGMLLAGLIVKVPYIKNQRWFFEFYGGIGAKSMNFKEINLPVGGVFVNPPDRDFLDLQFDSDRSTVSRPMLPGGLRLFYLLRR